MMTGRGMKTIDTTEELCYLNFIDTFIMERFEIIGVPDFGFTDGPKNSRTHRYSSELFRNYRINIVQKSDDMPYEILEDLIVSCGWSFVSENSNFLIFSCKDDELEIEERITLVECSLMPVLGRHWALDSVGTCKVQDFENYQISIENCERESSAVAERYLVDPVIGDIMPCPREVSDENVNTRLLIDPVTGHFQQMETYDDDEDLCELELNVSGTELAFSTPDDKPVNSGQLGEVQPLTTNVNTIKVQKLSNSYTSLRDYKKM